MGWGGGGGSGELRVHMATAGILTLRSQNRYQVRFSHNNNAIHETAMQRRKKGEKSQHFVPAQRKEKRKKQQTNI